MLCEIINHYINVFFDEIKLKKENLKRVFWAPEFGRPNRYTDLLNGLATSPITFTYDRPISNRNFFQRTFIYFIKSKQKFLDKTAHWISLYLEQYK